MVRWDHGDSVVVVMIHLSLVVLDLVWVVDSGDCSLIGVCGWWVFRRSGDCESVVVREAGLGWGVGWVVV